MKIKKIFGLVSIASLAVLMTACGKTKNETIFDSKIFSLIDQDKADYKKETASKKKVVTVFENENVYQAAGSIYITEDFSNYYVYNIELEEKKILTIEKSGVYNIEYSTSRQTIIVTFDENSNGNYGYEAYMLDGTKLFDKVYCPIGLSCTSRQMNTYDISEFESIKPKYFEMTYTDEDYVTTIVPYYVVEHATSKSGIDSNKATVNEYYLGDAYETKYGSSENLEADGKIYGLKGYTVKKQGNSYTIFKKGVFVNKVEFNDSATYLITNGYALVQTSYEVSSNEDYDINIFSKYLKVKTYKINLKDSKTTELKNFHYLLETISSVYNDGVIESWVCEALDFKAHKQATVNDFRLALVKGTGSVELNESINFSGDLVLSEKNTYYSYTIDDGHSNVNEQTVIYNKNGVVTGAYNGIYYDDVLAIVDGDKVSFMDKDGNLKAILYNFTRMSLGIYTGVDILGNQSLVEIKDGTVTIVDTSDYYGLYGEFFTKIDGSYVEYFTYDSTLTKIDYTNATSSTFEFVRTVNGISYYTETNSLGTTLLYFE